ncbi:hypothetical protein D3C71_831000 [compost metagenome]
MTKASNRTRPLDRDGDGADGGSLPGNQTAPMASAEGDPNRPDDGPPNADQSPPAAESTSPREASALAFLDKHGRRPTSEDFIGSDEVAPLLDTDVGRYDDQLGRDVTQEDVDAQYVLPSPTETVDDLADARTTPGDSPEKEEAIHRETAEAKSAVAASVTGDTALAAIASACIEQALLDAEDAADLTDTFTPEEVAAAAQVNEAEGEAPAVDAEPTVIPTDDPLLQIETETAPIAVRERELRLLVESRRLYKSPEGYSSNYGAPYVDEPTVQAWITAGLAEDVPSAGNHGGVKPTHEARRQLGLIRHGEPA